MNKNIEPGKTLWYLCDGVGYLWLALTKRKKTAWVLFKEFWLWPLIYLFLLAIFFKAVFHFVGW